MLSKIKDIYQFKELLYYFAWRDLKVRYKQTALGALWVVLQPLGIMLIFVIFLSKIGRITDTGIPYAVYLFGALIYVNHFSAILNNVSNSIVGNASLIKKIYFPRIIPGLSQIMVASVDFCVRLVIFLALFPIFGVDLHWIGLVAVIPLLLVASAFSLGLGLWFAALNVKYRDVKQALPLVNQALFYMTPVFYAFSIVPEHLRTLVSLNPLVGIVVASRDLFFEGRINSPKYLMVSIAVSLIFLIGGSWYFFKEEPNFVDTV